jgi:hypothetical protein
MGTLQFVKATPISLRNHPEFSEVWLQERIAADPAILGLGEVGVIQRERPQHKAGRLDLLLFDRPENIRYEVELMLGATDESHIIRCIEYWDIERRRYPAYDHCAVLIAENVTTRFLNVLGLVAGSIPFIAIQLSALQVGEQVVLNFVRVLDRTPLRIDDEAEVSPPADRKYWTERGSAETVAISDAMAAIINERAIPKLQLKYNRSYIGLQDGNAPNNIVWWEPKPGFSLVMCRPGEPQMWKEQLEKAGLNVGVQAGGTLRISLKPFQMESQKDVIRKLLHAIVDEDMSV